VLRSPLIQPPLLAALGAAGHGGRLDFYAACREPDLAVCVATGDARLYANVLLTIGYIRPGTGGTHD
jgi:L-fucose mutarotase/ribose pyranase (RbsD/FucU family)